MVAGAVILDPADLVAADQRAARPPVLEVGLEKAPNRSAAQLPRPAGGKDPHLVADHHGMRVGPLELRVPRGDRDGDRQRHSGGGAVVERPHPDPLSWLRPTCRGRSDWSYNIL
jgi:hypothetical protein